MIFINSFGNRQTKSQPRFQRQTRPSISWTLHDSFQGIDFGPPLDPAIMFFGWTLKNGVTRSYIYGPYDPSYVAGVNAASVNNNDILDGGSPHPGVTYNSVYRGTEVMTTDAPFP
jgi:hypothetical protein